MYFISQLAIHFMFYTKQGIGSLFRWQLYSRFAKHTIFASLSQKEKFLIFRAEKFLRESGKSGSVICEVCALIDTDWRISVLYKHCGVSGELRIFFGNAQTQQVEIYVMGENVFYLGKGDLGIRERRGEFEASQTELTDDPETSTIPQ